MKYRKQFIARLFEISHKVYTRIFKNHQPWGISKKDLLNYPSLSFGRHLGEFLAKNGFDLIPKVERHDCYHILTGYSTKIEDEIALQYLCYGNGKRSLYLLGAIILGTILLPDYHKYYINSFNIGKNSNSFHDFNYRKLLNVPIHSLRQVIFSKTYIQKIQYNI